MCVVWLLFYSEFSLRPKPEPLPTKKRRFCGSFKSLSPPRQSISWAESSKTCGIKLINSHRSGGSRGQRGVWAICLAAGRFPWPGVIADIPGITLLFYSCKKRLIPHIKGIFVFCFLGAKVSGIFAESELVRVFYSCQIWLKDSGMVEIRAALFIFI